MKKTKQPASSAAKPKQRVTGFHLIRVFLLYLTAAVAFAGWINLSSFDVFNPLLLMILAILLAVVATFFHWRFGQRNPVDDIADGEL